MELSSSWVESVNEHLKSLKSMRMFPLTISIVVAAEPIIVIGCENVSPGSTICLSGNFIIL